jgi:membrane protein implicated in regulation of membrane protease activity
VEVQSYKSRSERLIERAIRQALPHQQQISALDQAIEHERQQMQQREADENTNPFLPEPMRRFLGHSVGRVLAQVLICFGELVLVKTALDFNGFGAVETWMGALTITLVAVILAHYTGRALLHQAWGAAVITGTVALITQAALAWMRTAAVMREAEDMTTYGLALASSLAFALAMAVAAMLLGASETTPTEHHQARIDVYMQRRTRALNTLKNQEQRLIRNLRATRADALQRIHQRWNDITEESLRHHRTPPQRRIPDLPEYAPSDASML